MKAFDDWMNGGGISSLFSGIAVLVLVSPILALIHELGHASVGLLRTKGLVVVHLGGTPARWRLRIGRLQLELNPRLAARNEPPAFAATYARLGVGARAMSAVAGPFFHAVAAFLIVLIGARVHSATVEVAGGLGTLWALSSFVPRRRGHGSDGAHLLDALRGRVTAPTEL
ncbi:MAG TPA: hypothetical protein VNY33_07570, partial [Gaiellaceae bacterium]|nr:hypothetical protein [Gaiellaceae bacterium]